MHGEGPVISGKKSCDVFLGIPRQTATNRDSIKSRVLGVTLGKTRLIFQEEKKAEWGDGTAGMRELQKKNVDRKRTNIEEARFEKE